LPAGLPTSFAAHEAAWASRASFDESLAALKEAYRASFSGAAANDYTRSSALRKFKARFRPALELAPLLRTPAAGAAAVSDDEVGDGDGASEQGEGDDTRSMLGANDGVDEATRRGLWSSRYQWMPAEVAVDGAGSCRFVSYVNNVDPATHGPLYAALGAIMSRFLPIFERVLAEAASPEPPQLALPLANEEDIQEKWMEREKSKSQKGKAKKKKNKSEDSDEDEDTDEEMWERWRDARRTLPAPNPSVPAWAPRSAPPLISLRNRRIQASVASARVLLRISDFSI
jgi:hypothetical protein